MTKVKLVLILDFKPGYTLPFTSPERFNNSDFSYKSDIFSLGILIFHGIFHGFPYTAEKSLTKSLKKNSYFHNFFFSPESVDYTGFSKVMLRILAIIERCMHEDVDSRPEPLWLVILFK